MNKSLKLNFNERNDKPSLLDEQYGFERSLSLYPERLALEIELAKINGVASNQVFATNGGDEAIYLLMRILNEGKEFILPLPAFSQYLWGKDSWQLKGITIEPKSDLSLDLEKTEQAIKQSSKAVVIVTSPNNPTGELIEENRLRELISLAKKNNSWVFLDNAYIEFAEENCQQKNESKRVQALLAEFDNLIILKTLSKAYGLAGIRLGYLLANEKLLAEFKQRAMPFNVSQPSIEIAMSAIQAANNEEVIDYCTQIKANRAKIQAWCAKNSIATIPSAGNFLLLQLPNKQAQAIASFLKRNNIEVKTFVEPLLQNCLRLTIPYQIEKLFVYLQQTLTPSLLCFDMDGVLIDTSDSYDASIKATVAVYSDNLVVQSEIETLKDQGGFNNDWQVAQECLRVRGIEMSLTDVTEKFQQLYLGDSDSDSDSKRENDQRGFVNNEVSFINLSMKDSLNKLTESAVTIVTGRPKKEAFAGVSLVGLKVAAVISLDDVVEPKPSAEGIIKLQQEYRARGWMCGDNVDDMQAAVASNSMAIGVGTRNAEALYQAGADVVLDNINQLETWLCPLK